MVVTRQLVCVVVVVSLCALAGPGLLLRAGKKERSVESVPGTDGIDEERAAILERVRSRAFHKAMVDQPKKYQDIEAARLLWLMPRMDEKEYVVPCEVMVHYRRWKDQPITDDEGHVLRDKKGNPFEREVLVGPVGTYYAVEVAVKPGEAETLLSSKRNVLMEPEAIRFRMEEWASAQARRQYVTFAAHDIEYDPVSCDDPSYVDVGKSGDPEPVECLTTITYHKRGSFFDMEDGKYILSTGGEKLTHYDSSGPHTTGGTVAVPLTPEEIEVLKSSRKR